METPKRALKFTSNERFGDYYKKKWTTNGMMTSSLAILTGISAGLTETMAIVPFELIKVRLQDKSNASI